MIGSSSKARRERAGAQGTHLEHERDYLGQLVADITLSAELQPGWAICETVKGSPCLSPTPNARLNWRFQ